VTERLYNDASTRLEKQARTQNTSVRAASTKLEEDSYTFKPAICSTSKLLTENNELYQGSFKNFEQRQQEYLSRQVEKRQELQSKYADEAKYKFRPEINLNSEVICATDPSRCSVSDRLY
jgi:hypothetical protein